MQTTNYNRLGFIKEMGIKNNHTGGRMFNWVLRKYPDLCFIPPLGDTKVKLIKATESQIQVLRELPEIIDVINKEQNVITKIVKKEEIVNTYKENDNYNIDDI